MAVTLAIKWGLLYLLYRKRFSESLAHPTAKTNEPSDPLHSACGIRRKHRRVHPVDRRAVAGHGVFLTAGQTNTRPPDATERSPKGQLTEGRRGFVYYSEAPLTSLGVSNRIYIIFSARNNAAEQTTEGNTTRYWRTCAKSSA